MGALCMVSVVDNRACVIDFAITGNESLASKTKQEQEQFTETQTQLGI